MTCTDICNCKRCMSPIYGVPSAEGMCGSCVYSLRRIDDALTTTRSWHPELMKPVPRTEWEKAHARMSELMLGRLESGRQVFGDGWLNKTEGTHIRDMIEELVDFSNYAAFLVYRLEKRLNAIEREQGSQTVDSEGAGVPGTHCA